MNNVLLRLNEPGGLLSPLFILYERLGCCKFQKDSIGFIDYKSYTGRCGSSPLAKSMSNDFAKMN